MIFANDGCYHVAAMRKNVKKLLGIALATAAACSLSLASSEAVYWISKTGKTHNSTCRYYKTCKGFASPVGSGDNCKICGGAGK